MFYQQVLTEISNYKNSIDRIKLRLENRLTKEVEMVEPDID